MAGCRDVSISLLVIKLTTILFMQRYLFIEEKELLLLIKQGHEAAFERIYKLYSPRLFANIYKMVRSQSTAQEILQEVFIKVWNNRAGIDSERSFRSYLFRIAENNVYDFFRKAARDKRQQSHLLAVAIEHYEHIEEILLRKENALILQKAIDSLSPQRHEVFRLCKLEGKSYDEVSKQLGISSSTISDHIVKANKAVREYLIDHMDMTILLFCLLFSAGY